MTEQLDPFAVLGVASDATRHEISHAYRQLLQRHHPDTRQPEDSESVVDLTVAARTSWSYLFCYLGPTCSSMSV